MHRFNVNLDDATFKLLRDEAYELTEFEGKRVSYAEVIRRALIHSLSYPDARVDNEKPVVAPVTERGIN